MDRTLFPPSELEDYKPEIHTKQYLQGTEVKLGNIFIYFEKGRPILVFAPGLGKIGTYSWNSIKARKILYNLEVIVNHLQFNEITNMTGGDPFRELIKVVTKNAFEPKLEAARKNQEWFKQYMKDNERLSFQLSPALKTALEN